MQDDLHPQPELDDSASRLAAITDSSDDAIISKQLDGTVTSWNKSAEKLFGYTAEEMVGESILRIIPDDRHHEEQQILERLKRGDRIEHFETIRRRKDGTLVPISATITPITLPDGTIVGATKLACDITERNRAQKLLVEQAQRLSVLQQISAAINADLDLDRIIQTVTDQATLVSGAKFGAFFNVRVADDSKRYMLYSLSGASREAFEGFGMPRRTPVFAPTFDGTEIVRSGDIRQDPRYGQNAPHQGMPHGHLPVVSYLAVPVKSSTGEVLGGLFFGHDEPDQFSADTEALIAGIAAQAAIAIDNARLHDAAQREIERRRQAEETKDILLRELRHRISNTMAMVQAIASQTLRETSPKDREAFQQRLSALSSAHDLLTKGDWKDVLLHHLAERALMPFRQGNENRITVSGCEAFVSSSQALMLTLALHELGTNAVKYGALSNDKGTVALDWQFIDENDPSHLRLSWTEHGGPPVHAPTRKGFGSRLISRVLKNRHGGATTEFAEEGLKVVIELDLDRD